MSKEMIKVPMHQLSDILEKEIDLVIDGVRYWYIADYKDVPVPGGRTRTIVFERYADGMGRHFALDIITVRGHGLQYDTISADNDCTLYPVKLHEEVVRTFTRE